MKSTLFQDEYEKIRDFEKKIYSKTYSHEDVVAFKERLESLTSENLLMCKISDRLQQKMDVANIRIRENNLEIVNKNKKLNKAMDNLMKAKIGKKASTIMFTITILFFVSEELYFGPLVEYFFGYAFLVLILKGLLALGLKFFESVIESIMTQGIYQYSLKKSWFHQFLLPYLRRQIAFKRIGFSIDSVIKS